VKKKTKTRRSVGDGQKFKTIDAQRGISEQVKRMTKPQLLKFLDELKRAFDENKDRNAGVHAEELRMEKARYSALHTETDNLRREVQRSYEEIQFLKSVVNKMVRS